MHVDIKDRLQDTTPEGVPTLDHQRLQRRGRRRRYVKRAGTAAAVAVMVVAAVVAMPWPGSDVTIDGGYAGSGNPDSADQQAAAAGWEDLSVTEAIDRLTVANQEASAPTWNRSTHGTKRPSRQVISTSTRSPGRTNGPSPGCPRSPNARSSNRNVRNPNSAGL